MRRYLGFRLNLEIRLVIFSTGVAESIVMKSFDNSGEPIPPASRLRSCACLKHIFSSESWFLSLSPRLALTDAQAISLVRLIKNTIVLTRLPKDYSLDKIDAVDAVYELSKESDYKEIDKKEIDIHIKQADEHAVGSVAKDFLLFISTVGDKDLVQQLDEELNNPADELAAVIEPMSLLLVIFGGIALLNVVSSIRY